MIARNPGETVLIHYDTEISCCRKTNKQQSSWVANLEKEESQESGSSLKVLAEKKAAGPMMRKRKRIEVPGSPSRPRLDRAKMGTSSQGLSKKKPPVETRRNRERKTQQEWQETPAFDTTDVQHQDSKWEDSPAGKIIPPLKQNNPPPPEGPTELGTSGFFGFLRDSYLPTVFQMPMASPQTLLLCLLVLAVIEGQGRQAAIPGCHLHPFNVTVRSDHKGTCQGSHVAQACVGHCESSAFPSRYSVLVASGYRHNITSVSQCCTISTLRKVKVHLHCGGDRREELEIFTARACQCDMCRLSRY
ncbi:Glycoprotein hormone alpha-2 [Camelus dromedarius]|uniref:Glycoprotein hormone alpha-2 n=1 Tax=Camelus dromedarius TaxID=9838 RepID=A0A5N4BYM9_CAMDR|nr:Glycoprotein hormone alpha-2 [Camelus dromedarius]